MHLDVLLLLPASTEIHQNLCIKQHEVIFKVIVRRINPINSLEFWHQILDLVLKYIFIEVFNTNIELDRAKYRSSVSPTIDNCLFINYLGSELQTTTVPMFTNLSTWCSRRTHIPNSLWASTIGDLYIYFHPRTHNMSLYAAVYLLLLSSQIKFLKYYMYYMYHCVQA